ncbi:MAG: DUF1887 family protein [Verrucomicrobiales bacterium]|nr:DUF1887 family protein [Verrucomicrobiales bacterium]
MTLLSLASKQIWPQVLAVLHERPERLVLFHSTEQSESLGPAERLRDFFQSAALPGVNPPTVDLRPVPHDRFPQVVDALATVSEESSLNGSNCRVNLTGGNKLMAMAAAEWCRLAEVPCFYLERDLRVFRFLPVGRDLQPQPDFKLDLHLARDVDALALLRCQMDAAAIVSPGQRLTLNQQGQRMPEVEFSPLLNRHHDFRKFLMWDVVETEDRAGDGLEYAVAFVLLKLGVPAVHRSIRLSPRVLRGSGREEGELDLVFNWAGKLWVVDCKDRHAAGTRIDQLRTELLSQVTVTPRLETLLTNLAEELRERDLKPLKEDLLVASEAAGLLGRALCVRRSPLPVQAEEFATSRKLPVILKDRLFPGLRAEIHAR